MEDTTHTMAGLIWYRNDYRVMNHSPLLAARERHEDLVAVIFECPEQWRKHHYSKRRQALRQQAIAALQHQLKLLNIPLLYIEREDFKAMPLELLKICRKLNVTHIYFNREYAYYERLRDAEVKDLLRDQKVTVVLKDDHIVVPPEMMPDKDLSLSTSFESYHTLWSELAQPIKMGETPKPCPIRMDCASYTPRPSDPNCTAMESKAHRLLHQFSAEWLAQGSPIKNAKQEMYSKLSPYITLGVISIAQCLAIARKHDNEAAQQWTEGLNKRCYFRYAMHQHPRIGRWKAFNRLEDSLIWKRDREVFTRWKKGETGYPLIDAAMRELNATGWLSHDLRSLSATFLSKNLMIDWRWGAKYFMKKLMDADYPSNVGGWQWAASIGTIALPYFRLVDSKLEIEKLDPHTLYIKKWITELKSLPTKEIITPSNRSLLQARSYPEPVVDEMQAKMQALDFFSSLK